MDVGNWPLLIQSFVDTWTCFGLWVFALHSAQGSWGTEGCHFSNKDQGFPEDRGCVRPVRQELPEIECDDGRVRLVSAFTCLCGAWLQLSI